MPNTDVSKTPVAVVTGGGRGIGKAIVQMLAEEGYRVAFNYHANAEAAGALEQEIKKNGGEAKATRVDIKDFDDVKKWIEETKSTFGRLDVLINNAGIVIDKPLMLMSRQDWDAVIDTNLSGMFNASRSSIVTFMKQKQGSIINISSLSGIIGLVGQSNYSATKGGMNAFTKALAKEVAGYGIRVNAVAPGYIETDILSGLKEEQRARINETIPLGRIGAPEDVARCVKFLLSPKATYITGQVIRVDGGLAIR